MSRRTTRNRLIISTGLSWIATSLLFLYLAGSLQNPGVHDLIHTDHSVEDLHSAENEKDPCHITVYHKDRDEGCHHASHVTTVKKCPLCEIVFHSEHITADRDHFTRLPFGERNVVANSSSTLFDGDLHLPARAPPTM